MSRVEEATKHARSVSGFLASVAIAAGVAMLPLLDGVKQSLGVGVLAMSLAMGVFIVLSAVDLVWKFPVYSNAWVTFDITQTVAIQLSITSLIVYSHKGDNIMWILLLAHASVGAGAGYPKLSHAAICVSPVLGAVAFLAMGQPLGLVCGILVSGLNTLAIWTRLKIDNKLTASNNERERLARLVTDQRVEQERLRISRDIHDGIGAELAAIDWRLRNLAEEHQASQLGEDVAELRDRLEQGVTHLQTVIRSLRGPEQSWQGLCGYLRQRITELCFDRVELRFDVLGDGHESLNGYVALEYTRCVLELSRNAVRHASASVVHVRLELSAETAGAEVSDNGRGLKSDDWEASNGGLANLKHRIAAVGGSLLFPKESALSVGTSIAFRLKRNPPLDSAKSL